MWSGVNRLWNRFNPEGKTGKVLEKVIVPLTVAVVGVLVSLATYYGKQRAEEERSQRTILQAYFDGIQTLLLEEDLRGDPDKKVDARKLVDARNLARARTLKTLDALDKTRSRRVLRFLYETELIQARTAEDLLHPSQLNPEQQPIVSLKYVELGAVNLRNRQLLREADLEGAYLAGADLTNADLSGANLRNANLNGADLSGTDLTKADLSGAKGVTDEQLRQQASSVQGATCPTGECTKSG